MITNEMREIIETFSLLYEKKLLSKEKILRSLSHYVDTTKIIFTDTKIIIK